MVAAVLAVLLLVLSCVAPDTATEIALLIGFIIFGWALEALS